MAQPSCPNLSSLELLNARAIRYIVFLDDNYEQVTAHLRVIRDQHQQPTLPDELPFGIHAFYKRPTDDHRTPESILTA